MLKRNYCSKSFLRKQLMKNNYLTNYSSYIHGVDFKFYYYAKNKHFAEIKHKRNIAKITRYLAKKTRELKKLFKQNSNSWKTQTK